MPEATVLMEDMRVIFRNFAGKEAMFNREGDRNFCVLLDDEIADKMNHDGWNIKYLKPRAGDEEQIAQAYLHVAVRYKGRPPRVVMVTSGGRTDLSEDEVEVLDWADIDHVDLIVRPYEWIVSGNSGVKAYLKTLFAFINEDELEMKYRDLDQIPSRSGRVDEGVGYDTLDRLPES